MLFKINYFWHNAGAPVEILEEQLPPLPLLFLPSCLPHCSLFACSGRDSVSMAFETVPVTSIHWLKLSSIKAHRSYLSGIHCSNPDSLACRCWRGNASWANLLQRDALGSRTLIHTFAYESNKFSVFNLFSLYNELKASLRYHYRCHETLSLGPEKKSNSKFTLQNKRPACLLSFCKLLGIITEKAMF